MISAIRRFLSRGRLEQARIARFRAWCAHAEAMQRKDYRLMRQTRKVLLDATSRETRKRPRLS